MGGVADPVAIAVEALVIVPVVAAPVVFARIAAAEHHRDMNEIVLEAVAVEDMAAALAGELDADGVVGDPVAEQHGLVRLFDGRIGEDADGAVDDFVAFRQVFRAHLEGQPRPAHAERMEDPVAPDLHPIRIQHDDAGGGVGESVALDHAVRREEQVDAVAAVADGVADDPVAGGIHQDEVARLVDVVALDQVVHAVPEANRLAPHRQFRRLGADAVAAQDVAVGLLQADAEQRIVDLIILDAVVVAGQRDAGIHPVVGIPGMRQPQAPHHCTAGVHDQHRAGAAAVDRDLAAAIHNDRPRDRRRTGIGARWRTQRSTGRGRIDQGLEGRIGCRRSQGVQQQKQEKKNLGHK